MFPLIIKVKSALIIGSSLKVVSEHRLTGLLRKHRGKGAALPRLAIHPRGLNKPCTTSRASPSPQYQLPEEILSFLSPPHNGHVKCLSAWSVPKTAASLPRWAHGTQPQLLGHTLWPSLSLAIAKTEKHTQQEGQDHFLEGLCMEPQILLSVSK